MYNLWETQIICSLCSLFESMSVTNMDEASQDSIHYANLRHEKKNSVAGSKIALIFLEMGYFCHCIFSLISKEDQNIALIPLTKYLINVNSSEKRFKFSKKKPCL